MPDAERTGRLANRHEPSFPEIRTSRDTGPECDPTDDRSVGLARDQQDPVRTGNANRLADRRERGFPEMRSAVDTGSDGGPATVRSAGYAHDRQDPGRDGSVSRGRINRQKHIRWARRMFLLPFRKRREAVLQARSKPDSPCTPDRRAASTVSPGLKRSIPSPHPEIQANRLPATVVVAPWKFADSDGSRVLGGARSPGLRPVRSPAPRCRSRSFRSGHGAGPCRDDPRQGRFKLDPAPHDISFRCKFAVEKGGGTSGRSCRAIQRSSVNSSKDAGPPNRP